MLAKDMFTLNNVDSKIQDMMSQLQELIDKRTEIVSPIDLDSASGSSASPDFDLSAVDLSLESSGGLSIAGR